MTAFLIYVLKSALVLALLVSLFLIFMSRETFHRVNRYIMLSIVFLALLLPAVNLGIESPFKGVFVAVENYLLAEEPLEDVLVAERAFDELLFLPDTFSMQNAIILSEFMPVGNIADEPVEEEAFDWLLLATVVYFLVVVVLVVRQAVMYIQVLRIILRSRVVDASLYGFEGISLSVYGGKERPFSWFRWVVVSEDDLDVGAREILIHETAHVRAGHSWDIMLADAVIIMQWFNPLAWIMKNSLKDIHEFEADETVINSGVNAKQYQLLIIKKAVGARLYSIANSFNHSLTKKRITMMCKEKSKKWRCAKALYIVPVAAIAALAFTTVDTANATVSETLPKGSEFVVNNEKETAENYLQQVPAGDDDKVYQVCEKAPVFPGGTYAMYKYLAGNIKYPAEAHDAGKEGRAAVAFVVKKDGSITDVEIVKSAGDESLDKEAVRVVSAMPKWNPGTQGGKPVNVRFTLPVVFKSQKSAQTPAIEIAGSAAPSGKPANTVIVIDGVLCEGELPEIVPEDIESATVMRTESMKAEDIKKYKAEGKDGVLFIALKKHVPMLEIGSNSGVYVQNPDDLAIVIDGALYEGKLQDVNAENIESITVVPIEKLSGEELEKCKQIGKKGAIYIEKKRYEFNTLGGSEAVFQVCEQQPAFPGGERELMMWLSSNIKYPKAARDINGQGKIYVSFVVMADGTIADVKTISSEYASKNAKVSDVMNYEAHLLRCQAILNTHEAEMRDFEKDIAKWERESKVLEEDGVAEVILERRREELEKARIALEDFKKRVARARVDVEEARKLFEDSKNELDEVVVTAYKNSKVEPVTGGELLELEKTALVALCDEAERVVKAMPKWTPGMQGGKPVNVQHTLPIIFRLQ